MSELSLGVNPPSHRPEHRRAGRLAGDRPAGDGGSSVQAVDRAAVILQLLAHQGDTRASDLARSLEVNRSTAFRILLTLEGRGFVVQDRVRGMWRLGPGLMELVAVGGGSVRPSPANVRPLLEQLAEEVGDTVNIAVYDGEAVVSVDQVIGGRTLKSHYWIGQRTPVHATSAGKVFLAHMPAEQRRHILAGPLPAFTPATVTKPSDLEAEIDQVRLRGYAAAIEEHEVGLAAVAAPVFDVRSVVTSAVTVSGPVFHFGDEHLGEIVAALQRAAGAISRRNGWLGSYRGQAAY